MSRLVPDEPGAIMAKWGEETVQIRRFPASRGAGQPQGRTDREPP